MNDNAGGEKLRLRDAVITHDAFVHLRAGVEGDDACLGHVLALNALLAIHKLDREAKRTFVENLIINIAFWIMDGHAVAFKQGGRAGSECRAYLVAVHAVAVVHVVAYSIVEVVGKIVLAAGSELLAHGRDFRIKLAGIARLNNKVGCALVPDVITPGTLTVTLKSWSVAAECYAVVLPCDVVDTLRKLTSEHLRFIRLRCSGSHKIF